MYGKIKQHLSDELTAIEATGLYKCERIITDSQKSEITLAGNDKVINFCANNYLGLSNSLRLIEAAKRTMETHGFGISSVRFICGTQDFATRLLDRGIYVTGFYYPVVPKDQVRIQVSAGDTREHLDKYIVAFRSVGIALGVLKIP